MTSENGTDTAENDPEGTFRSLSTYFPSSANPVFGLYEVDETALSNTSQLPSIPEDGRLEGGSGENGLARFVFISTVRKNIRCNTVQGFLGVLIRLSSKVCDRFLSRKVLNLPHSLLLYRALLR